MKKLLVLALAALMVLSLAAVSMAAVTVSGEVQYKYDFSQADGVNGNEATLTGLSKPADKTKGLDALVGKFKIDATVADNMEAVMVVKNDPGWGGAAKNKGFFFDETWFKVTGDMVDFQVGYFGFGFGGKKDIIDLYTKDLKGEAGTLFNIKPAEGITLGIYYALDGTQVDTSKMVPITSGAFNTSYSIFQGKDSSDIAEGDGAYGIKLNYDADTFGFGVGFMNYAAKGYDIKEYVNTAGTSVKSQDLFDSGLALNGYYKMDAVTFYLVYDSIKSNGLVSFKDDGTINDYGVTLTNQIIGVMYDSADVPFYGRFEYDLVKQDDYFRFIAKQNSDKDWKDAGMNPWGLRLGYKFNGNVKLEYNRKQQTWAQDKALGDNNIKVVVSF